MPPDRAGLPIAGALPLLGVVLSGAIIVIAILAWLAREVAFRIIDRSAPDHIADAVRELAALISAFRFFLPWSKMQGLTGSPPRSTSRRRQHNELSDELPKEDRDET